MLENQLVLKQQSRSLAQIEKHLNDRKVIRPTREELSSLIWSKPTTTLAKHFGVSDNAISKWCKYYGIDKPGRGHWKKMESVTGFGPA